MNDGFHIYDTTLRDGCQGEDMNLSVDAKLAVARCLDDLGVGFIEGGWPGANPKDTAFFARAAEELTLRTAQLAAFGATCRPGSKAPDDPQLAALRRSGAHVVTLVAKSDIRHVTAVLRTTPEENLRMVRDSVRYLRSEGHRVFLDAEHFFDGYRADPHYAAEVLVTAAEAGADVVVLCDTNGGVMPQRLEYVVHDIVSRGLRTGIHCHNDLGCAVANTLLAVGAGATHVQGTANGYGERTGNADLFAVMAALEEKFLRPVLPQGRLRSLSGTSREIARIAKQPHDPRQPWVGRSAFAHKAGLHISAVRTDPKLYNHADPAHTGNEMRLLVSEASGRAAIEAKAAGLGHRPEPGAVSRVLARVKQLEADGHSLEHADGSLDLILGEETGAASDWFSVRSWRVTTHSAAAPEAPAALADELPGATAFLEVDIVGTTSSATASGSSPLGAFDVALRIPLERAYGSLRDVRFIDQAVTVLDVDAGRDARVAVRVVFCDEATVWATVAVSPNVVAASLDALKDAYRVALNRRHSRGIRALTSSVDAADGSASAPAQRQAVRDLQTATAPSQSTEETAT